MNFQSRATRSIRLHVIAATLASATTSAFAQISKVDTVMTNVQTVLAGVAIVTFSIAFMWIGYKMAFQHAKFSEIVNILIGGILVGGSSGLAAWLIA